MTSKPRVNGLSYESKKTFIIFGPPPNLKRTISCVCRAPGMHHDA